MVALAKMKYKITDMPADQCNIGLKSHLKYIKSLGFIPKYRLRKKKKNVDSGCLGG